MILHALTLHQPWATMISSWSEFDAYVAGGGTALLPKRIENRAWPPPEKLKGAWLAVHAGKEFDNDGNFGIRERVRAIEAGTGTRLSMPYPSEMTAGAVVAVARIAGFFFQAVLKGETSPRWGYESWWSAIRPEAEAPGQLEHLPAMPLDVTTDPHRYWLIGPYGWVLTDVVRLASPVPVRGAQKVWNLPADVAAQVEEQARLAGWQP